MLAYEILTGKKHFIGNDNSFVIDTICGKEIPCDAYLKVEGLFPDCDCGNCLLEIAKDLHRRPKNKSETYWVDANKKAIKNIYE